MKNYGLRGLQPQRPSAPSAGADDDVPSLDHAIALLKSAKLDPVQLGYWRGKFDSAMAVVRERPARPYDAVLDANGAAAGAEGDALKREIEKAFPGVRITSVKPAGYGRRRKGRGR